MGEKLTSDKNNRSLVFGAALYASLAIDSWQPPAPTD